MTSLSQKSFNEARNDDAGFNISFEVFPPIGDAGQRALAQVARDLARINPGFFSVTYGAGGSSRQRTLDTLEQIASDTGLNLAGHLTCINADRAEIDAVAGRYLEMGVRHIVALRGDMPDQTGPYRPHPNGYRNAADLVAGLKRRGDFEISVAAYPEIHPDSPSRRADIENLKAKFDAGADRAITQFFFDNHLFTDFLNETAAAGIDQPIVPGILLIHDFNKVKRFAQMCGASIPAWLTTRFDGLENDTEAHRLTAVGVAVEQVLDLAAHGVRNFHFYTMNRSDLALAVCRSLGIRAKAGLRSVA